MSEVWYVVSVEDSLESRVLGDGVRLRYSVSPHNSLIEEKRTDEEVLEDAAARGFNGSYCSTFCGISDQRLFEIRRAVRNKLFLRYGSFPTSAISIEPRVRLAR
jgi:hypothetical protein